MSSEKGIKKTNWSAVKNPPFPAEVVGNHSYNNYHLVGGIIGFLVFVGYFFAISRYSSPWKNKVNNLPEKNIEEYIKINDASLSTTYTGRKKIPMEIFFESYFDEKIDLCSDALEILEARHDWVSFEFGLIQTKFFLFQWIPETIVHSKKQDENQVRGHYDRGDDFYAAFLGPSMVYTSGIISDATKNETLEEIQENKHKLVCERMKFKNGERHLDIGCGWGTFVAYASKNYGTNSTGITLGVNQTAFGNERIKEYGVSQEQARIKCMDYRDIPPTPKYNKITCLEMSEHVGVRLFPKFLEQVIDMLEDDGLFFLQISGLRRTWQYEDLIWGLFIAKYIFPGADASCPLAWVINQLECAGFEVYSVDTIGVHYSGTIWRWYQNWLKNRDTIITKYGTRWYRIWEIFLAWSIIISRQGSATCYQIIAHKNFNSADRASLITSRLLS